MKVQGGRVVMWTILNGGEDDRKVTVILLPPSPQHYPSLTIVFHVAGFLPACVWADAKDLHSHQWIHNGLLFGLVHFRELLTTDHL